MGGYSVNEWAFYEKKTRNGATMKCYPNLWYELCRCKMGLGGIAARVNVTPKLLRAWAKNAYIFDFLFVSFPNVRQAMDIDKCLGGFSSNYLYSGYLWSKKPVSKRKKARKHRKAHQK